MKECKELQVDAGASFTSLCWPSLALSPIKKKKQEKKKDRPVQLRGDNDFNSVECVTCVLQKSNLRTAEVNKCKNSSLRWFSFILQM